MLNRSGQLDATHTDSVNSLAPVRFQFNFRKVIFKLTLMNGGWGMSYEIAVRWMPLDLTDDKSTLVQVMAWCRQATSHYLSQCWPRSMSPNGVTRPQWVNTLRLRQNGRHFADDFFRCIFFKENTCISINISLKFVPKSHINTILALVLIMAWRRPGDTPLSESMIVSLLTHKRVTQPRWVKTVRSIKTQSK